MWQRHVPHRPPPHLNGMPPLLRSEMRSRFEFSGASTRRPPFVTKVTEGMARSLSSVGQRRALEREAGGAARETLELAPRAIDALEALQQLRRNAIDHVRRRLVDDRHARR